MKNIIFGLSLLLSEVSVAAVTELSIEIPFAVMSVSNIKPSTGAGGQAEVTLDAPGAKDLQLKLQCSGGRTWLTVTSRGVAQHLTAGDFYAQGCQGFINLLISAGIQKSTMVELRYYGPHKFPGLLINRFVFIPSGADAPFVPQ